MLLDTWYANKLHRIAEAPPTSYRTALLQQSLSLHLGKLELPLLTLKPTPWRTAIAEMQWFISGNYSYESLLAAGVRWWQPWAQRLADEQQVPLAKLVFSNTTLPYKRHRVLYLRLVNELRHSNHSDTRLYASLWPELPELAILPPCALAYQLLPEGNKLHMTVYQRSADLLCGVPSNVAQYAWLLHKYCDEANYEPGCLQFHFGSLHVYRTHMAQPEWQTLLARQPSECKHALKSLREPLELLSSYEPQSALKFPVVPV